jgi:hypothetical protein
LKKGFFTASGGSHPVLPAGGEGQASIGVKRIGKRVKIADAIKHGTGLPPGVSTALARFLMKMEWGIR